MNKTLTSLLATSLLAVALPAMAAETADLAVTGTIIPGSCDVTLTGGASGGSTVNLGKMSSASLNKDTATVLPADSSVSVGVACTAKLRFALQTVDQRADSSTLPNGYGLGKTTATIPENIGHYTLAFIDGTDTTVGPLKQTVSTDGATWSSPGAASVVPAGSFVGFVGTGAGNTEAPVELDAVSAKVQVTATIAPTDGLTLDTEQTIDGMATLEVKYL